MENSIPARYLLDAPITALPFEEQILLLLKWARKRESRMVCLANVHMLMEAHWKQEFASVLNNADMVTPDGMPLVWMLRKLEAYNQDRVAGMDVFTRLCEIAPMCNISIFFLGSETQVLQSMKQRLEKEFPKLQIAGMESLPFRQLTEAEDKEIIEKINNSGAGLVFVCLGCPKQEIWMAQHRGKIRAVMIGLGAVFPLYAGFYKRAPKYVRDSGFEWLHRLVQEPKRLWRRYSKTIPPFIYLALKQLLGKSKVRLLKKIASKYPLIGRIKTNLKAQVEEAKLDEAANSPDKIGEILIRQNLVTSQELTLALEEQEKLARQKINTKIGEILIEKGYISQPEFDYHLRNQNIKLGELLVDKKIITNKQLNRILKSQKLNSHKLGEILLKEKLISSDKLNEFLQEQYRRRKGWWLNYEK